MDAGSFSPSSSSISSTNNSMTRLPLREHTIPHRHTGPRKTIGDRFIPVRSAMDFDMAHYLLSQGRKEKENAEVASSPSKEAYKKQLAEALNMNRTRILAFKAKPPAPAESIFQDSIFANAPSHQVPSKPRRYIPQTAERTLDAPDIVDDYYLNLLDWSSGNVVAIALGSTVYLWEASTGSTSELVTIDDDKGPVTSVNWAPDGRHIAIGLNSSDVQLWDPTANRKLRTLQGAHNARVGALSWNNHVLTTGGMDGLIVNNDVRIRSHIMHTYRGHQGEVCGLKWSASGQQLASGGNDNLLHIWDRAAASSNSPTQWLHRFEDHTAAVKALAWCPFQSNLIASGGGAGDRCIKFWNTHTGACLNSVDTGSQVCSLLWSKSERELLSSHGFTQNQTQNQLSLWKYPSMVKMAELTGHTSRVLFMAQSPDGCTVASAAGDETLRFWNVFGTPQAAKPAAKATNAGPFQNFRVHPLGSRWMKLIWRNGCEHIMLGSMSLLKQRLKLQAGIIKKGLLPTIVFSNALIDEHARVGAMNEARKVFDLMPDRNIFTWNAIIHGYVRNHDLARARGMFDCALEKDAVTYNSMISGYTRHGMVGEAIHVFRLMRKDGVSADDFTHTSMLNLAADVSGLACGIQIHGDMVKSGNGSASFSVSALIDMYSKCGRQSDAILVFNEVKECDDTVCRNAVLAACCREGNLKLGFDLFWCEPQSNDAVSWNTMISGCADYGDWGMALKLFVLMGENGIGRTEHSFSCGLRACTLSKSLDRGKEIHAYAIRNQLLSNPYISSGLVGLYSKCEKLDYAKLVHLENRRENVFSTASLIMGLVDEGNMVDARKLFDESNERNTVIWTTLFSGYVRFQQCEELFDLFTEYMRNEMVPCDVLILINVLSACSLQSDLDHGKQIHAFVLRNGIEMDEKLENAMVDMYAKCGKLQYSEEIFRQANVKDSVLYNAMMFGFAHHGRAKETLELLDEMLHEGFKPDEVTFLALLSACRHAGLVELGERYFTSMVKDYEVLPSTDHYSCMVDLYGRANHLDKALKLIRKMPWEADGVIWGSFLQACRVNGNMEMAKLSEEKLLHIEPSNGARYVQLANAYAAQGEWIELGRIRRQMRLHEAKRSAGCSWIHIGNKINVFTSGFTRHLESDAIFEMLAKINGEILFFKKASREMRKDDIFSTKNLLFTCIGEGCRPSICQT